MHFYMSLAPAVMGQQIRQKIPRDHGLYFATNYVRHLLGRGQAPCLLRRAKTLKASPFYNKLRKRWQWCGDGFTCTEQRCETKEWRAGDVAALVRRGITTVDDMFDTPIDQQLGCPYRCSRQSLKRDFTGA